MKKILLSSIFSILALVGQAKEWYSPKYFRGNLEEARVKAALEHKPLLISFYADWCLPCKWMEKSVMSDPEVIQYLDNQLIAIKIDITTYENKKISNAYFVNLLPTNILLDEHGTEISRKETSMDKAAFLNWLHQNKAISEIAPVDTKSIVQEELISESDIEAFFNQTESSASGIEKVDNTQVNKPTQTQQQTIKKESDVPLNRAKSQQQEPIKPAEIETASEKVQIEDVENVVLDSPKSVHRLQLACFSNVENAKKQANIWKKTYNLPIEIRKDAKQETIKYRILIGDFESLEEAELFKETLAQENIQSIIVQ